MPSAATSYPPEEPARSFEKRRKVDHEGGTSPPGPPPGHGGHDLNRYPYDPYGAPMHMRHPQYDEAHYRDPPSMPYTRGPAPSPKHPPHHHHPAYAYPPPPKDPYYPNPYHGHEYPPYHGWGQPPPHPYHAGKSGQNLSPRFDHHHEYDRQYYSEVPATAARPKPTPPNPADSTYQSPTSVLNTLDTRSPEGSRNLNQFEERVSVNGAPPSTAYPQPHQHPYYPPQATHSPPQAPPPPQMARQWWSCDYCSYKFANWEECSAHESMCPSRHTPPTSRKGKRSLIDIEAESRFMDPAEEYANNTDRETFTLAQPHDGESLSDRQCYVRTHFVELFVAGESDVSSRHSRGAQKLHINQIGMRCSYCAQLKARDRAERAVCYPSSISRIYQTVADMQRFHFEACTAIPPRVLQVYKSLKTTRPRGVGSPQSYWDKSARDLGLVDTAEGIQLRDGCSLAPSRRATEMSGGGVGGVPLPNLYGAVGEHSAAKEHPSEVILAEDEEKDETIEWVHQGTDCPQEGDFRGTEAKTHSQETSEADASILLMLKNPETTPKSTDDASSIEV